MRLSVNCTLLLSTVLMISCATSYQKLTALSYTGGHKVTALEKNIYRVVFSANGFTTRETAQTYWLYRCVELAEEKKADGFEILSHINLVNRLTPEQFFQPKEDTLIQPANYVYMPIYTDNSNKPFIEADIRLIYGLVEGSPPKVFKTEKLKASIELYVNGKKCGSGNVCQHVHKYIHPEGKFQETI